MAENTRSNVAEEIADYIANSDSQIFGVRNTTTEAFEYAMELAKANGMESAYMATAIMVYHNSLVKQLSETIRNQYVRDEKPNPSNYN